MNLKVVYDVRMLAGYYPGSPIGSLNEFIDMTDERVRYERCHYGTDIGALCGIPGRKY